MADNVELNAGTGGATIATDDIAGVQYQRVKLVLGANNTNDGDVATGNPMPVSDAGGSLTVDGTVAVTDGGGSLTVDGTVAVTNAGLTALNGAIAGTEVQVDVLTMPSVAVTNAGTFATQVTGDALTALQLLDNVVAVEDAVAGSGYSGVPFLAVRQDSHSDLAADGDFMSPTIDADGGLRVSIVAGAGSGGTAAADDADFTAGTTQGTPAMGVYESTPTSVTDGDLGTVGITQGRRLKTSATLDAAIPAGTNNIGDVDILSIAAGDNNIGNVDVVTLPNVTLAAGTNTNEVVGDVAHDAAAGGNPVLVAGVAQDTDDTAPPNRVSAESDATRLATNHDGALHVLTFGPQVWSYHVNGSSALTDTSVHAAPGAGLSLYVTDICISLGAATALNVFFEEGASTVLGPFYLEAVNGRTVKIEFKTPKKITANTALTVTSSAAVAHSIDVTGFTAND